MDRFVLIDDFMKMLVWAMVVPLFVAGCTSDNDTCTLIGCTSGLEVTLTGELAELEPGDYRLEYSAFEVDGFCTLTVIEGSAVIYGEGSDYGCEYRPDGDTFFVLFPDTVTAENTSIENQVASMSLMREDVVIAEGSAQLEIDPFYPNGRDCGDGCLSATATLSDG